MSEKPAASKLLIRALPSPSRFDRSPSPRRKTKRLRSTALPGYLDGLHHTLFVSAIRTLKSNGQHGDLEHLLLRLVDATEAEAVHTGCAVSTGYYRELARLYRKTKDTAREHAILQRFAAQTHAPGLRARRLVKRLATLPPIAGTGGGTGQA
jgi:hypothetical protein